MDDIKDDLKKIELKLLRLRKEIKEERPYKVIKRETKWQALIRRIKDKINFFLFKIGLY
jgi:hypothetical protein